MFRGGVSHISAFPKCLHSKFACVKNEMAIGSTESLKIAIPVLIYTKWDLHRITKNKSRNSSVGNASLKWECHACEMLRIMNKRIWYLMLFSTWENCEYQKLLSLLLFRCIYSIHVIIFEKAMNKVG